MKHSVGVRTASITVNLLKPPDRPLDLEFVVILIVVEFSQVVAFATPFPRAVVVVIPARCSLEKGEEALGWYERW